MVVNGLHGNQVGGYPHKHTLSQNIDEALKPLKMSESESVSHSVVSDSETPWTVAHQALLSMEFSRQKYWSGLPFPSPGDLPNPGMEPGSPALQADSLLSESPEKAAPPPPNRSPKLHNYA